MEPKQTTIKPFVRQIPQTEHICPVCQKVFVAPRLRVYCSSDCKQKASWERNKTVFNARRRQSSKWANIPKEEANHEG